MNDPREDVMRMIGTILGAYGMVLVVVDGKIALRSLFNPSQPITKEDLR